MLVLFLPVEESLAEFTVGDNSFQKAILPSFFDSLAMTKFVTGDHSFVLSVPLLRFEGSRRCSVARRHAEPERSRLRSRHGVEQLLAERKELVCILYHHAQTACRWRRWSCAATTSPRTRDLSLWRVVSLFSAHLDCPKLQKLQIVGGSRKVFTTVTSFDLDGDKFPVLRKVFLGDNVLVNVEHVSFLGDSLAFFSREDLLFLQSLTLGNASFAAATYWEWRNLPELTTVELGPSALRALPAWSLESGNGDSVSCRLRQSGVRNRRLTCSRRQSVALAEEPHASPVAVYRKWVLPQGDDAGSGRLQWRGVAT